MNPTRVNNGDGTWTLTYPNGVVQIVDGQTWQVVSETMASAPPLAATPSMAAMPEVAAMPGAEAIAAGAQPPFAYPTPQPIPAAAQPNPFDPSGRARATVSGQPSFAGGYAGGYAGGSYGIGGGSPTTPRYADGSQHPYFGGPPRVPGGRFASESSSGGGTFVPQLPYSPARSPSGGYGASGGGGGGGGGGGSALYHAWRDKLVSKLYPGSGSAYSSYGGSYGGGGGSVYTHYEYPEEKMRGQWARQVDPTQASAIMARPSMMIPRVAPGLDSRSPFYEDAATAPAGAMATIMSSRQRVKEPTYPTTRYRPDGTTVERPGRGGNVGSTTVNAIGDYYNNFLNKEQVPTFDQVANQLTHAKKNSLIGMQVNQQPAGYGLSALQGIIDAGLSETLDPRSAAAYSAEASALIDRMGSRLIKKPVGRGGNIAKKVSRRLF